MIAITDPIVHVLKYRLRNQSCLVESERMRKSQKHSSAGRKFSLSSNAKARKINLLGVLPLAETLNRVIEYRLGILTSLVPKQLKNTGTEEELRFVHRRSKARMG